MEILRQLFLGWWRTSPKMVERKAFYKDVQSLVTLAPNCVKSGLMPTVEGAMQLYSKALELFHLLRWILAVLICRVATPDLLVSPYAGGVPVHHVPHSNQEDEISLTIGVLNPGRCGLTGLNTNTLLLWRLWAIEEQQ